MLFSSILLQPNLSSTEPAVLGYMLKRYFSELPDPLIPSVQYDRFISAMSLPTEAAQVADLDALVAKLPPVNQAILSYMIAHFIK